MKYFSAIDLHSNNSYLVISDEEDRSMVEKRLANDLKLILRELEPFKSDIQGIAVESTYNWYWLVDGLMDAGYTLKLVNTSAIQSYSGLKYTNDVHDARWLAKLLRLDILPTGYIYPKEQRKVRDILRKRAGLVQQRSLNITSFKSMFARQLGFTIKSNDIHKNMEQFCFEDPMLEACCAPHKQLYKVLTEEIDKLEKLVGSQLKESSIYTQLQTTPGIGKILAATISLETGNISRFNKVGNYASYCRCVKSTRVSNYKIKGKGNAKCGNKYLSWAFSEAAHFAIRHYKPIKCFYDRKKRKSNGIIAMRAVAHKLARACYFIMRDNVEFDMKLAFG
ncbi:IS110 family transposase [Saccharobesus litoralis]|uniref:IS110 family transposase n=1 Tax=Saccharobesus litoralis TaxID=2172099 RepID=A0A2S0VR68_9ALTE|nr:IS110 family transposase [Saccharobesus litoralis]AWB66657.1 IS110 family transposase [Saccharobesus litoralis]AWB66703.1 IS110 family transposase [Saccharobesus litoralis]